MNECQHPLVRHLFCLSWFNHTQAMCITVLRCTTAMKCERTGEVLLMEHSHQAAGSYEKSNYVDIRWFWQALVVAVFMGLGPAAECLAFTVNPTVLTFNAVQNGTNPLSQTLSVRRFNFPVHNLSAVSPARERPRWAFESRAICGGVD